MRTMWSVVLFLAQASVASAQADLQVTSSASPSNGLWLDDEVLVSTTVRNLGPAAVSTPGVDFFGSVDDGYYFHVEGSDSPGCDSDAVDINPPRFNYSLRFPPLAAGQAHTCVARLVVFDLPWKRDVRHSGKVYANVADPNPGNNSVAVDFLFGTEALRTPRRIPASSEISLACIAIIIIALALRGARS